MKSDFSNYNVKQKTIKLTMLSLLCALSVVLSAADSMIPAMPFMPPGAKLGLSNIVTMYAAGFFGLVPALIIAVVKSLFAGLTRGLMAFLMSFFAGVVSTAVSGLLIISRKKFFNLIGIGIVGAIVHNLTQLIVAVLTTKTFSLVYYLPVLIIFALITGSVTGVVLNISIQALEKIKAG